jgi:hypothetical protein
VEDSGVRVVQDLSSQVDGARTTFDLIDMEAAIAGSIIATLSGVPQVPGTHFSLSLSGTQITFVDPPELGWSLVVDFESSVSGDSGEPVIASAVNPFP